MYYTNTLKGTHAVILIEKKCFPISRTASVTGELQSQVPVT